MKEKEIGDEIELAKMMVTDIDKVYKKYAKAALKASEERAEKIRKEKYFDCESIDELQEIYGYGDVSLEDYEKGKEYFNSREERKKQLTLVEQHRNNLKDLRDRWRGTVKELEDELNELIGIPREKEITYLEQLEQQERKERYNAMLRKEL